MPQATVVASWMENGQACLAVAVNEGGQRVEYVGRVTIDEAWDALTNPQKKAALVAACKQARDATIRPTAPDLGISGPVTV